MGSMGSMGNAVDHNLERTWSDMVFNHPIDEPRRLKVICIGAGISGIIAGIRFPQMVQNLDFVIYEKNPDVGGTWYENRYPGLRCDIPSASYQYTFENNSQWSEFYASGAEIHQYLKNIAAKYGVYNYCQFNHRLVSARWNEESGLWTVHLQNILDKTEVVDEANVLLTGTGILNKWDWPSIPGLDNFQGKKVHSADWDPKIDLGPDLNVSLIGAGSSGIQILPQLQPIVNRIDHYMKGRNWISPVGVGAQELALRNETKGNFCHGAEELEKFRKEPGSYLEFRRRVENSLNQAQLAVFVGTEAQKNFHKMTSDSMIEKLKSRRDVLDVLLPDFPVGCRRLTPGPGYLEACLAENVDYIGTPIKMVHKDSIETDDGKVRKTDIIICATGFDVSRKGELFITGQGGITLDEVWDPIPEAYLSMCPPKMPNLFMFLGPNGGPGAGSTIHMIEWLCDYMVECVKKIQREFIKSMVVSEQANKAFSRHVDEYFKKTIFAAPCKSWYKRGIPDGRLVTPWPGSSVHAKEAFKNPRWEDFEYELLPATEENSLAWLGNGLSKAQADGADTTSYLDTVIKPIVVDSTVDSGVPETLHAT